MEESAIQPRPLKFTIKLKSDKNNDVNPQDCVNLSSAGGSENHSTEAAENLAENSQYQLVLYDTSVNGAREAGTVHDLANYRSPSRIIPSVGAFTVQCANCFKWRLIPTKEKYEEIRENIMEQPFFCETGREWRPDISCEDPPDITQDGSRLWAIDKPNISRPPPGWQRLLRIRSEGSSKFADVYYVSPSGKRLRSMVEIQRYLDEHPEYKEAGSSLTKFSFQIPRPLQEDYVRKRPARPVPAQDDGDHGMPEPSDRFGVKPVTWVSPDVDTDLQLSGPGPSSSDSKSPVLIPEKKKKTPAKRRSNGTLVQNQNGIDR